MNKVIKPKKRSRVTNEKRSRNGCLTCRKRRVKCDEIHPFCGHCKRLNLKCSYNKIFSWDEESLNNGITFGRSNQFKKPLLIKKFSELKSSNNSIRNNDFDSFIKSNSLSKSLLNENIIWNKIENDSIYFINTTYNDFHKQIPKNIIKQPLHSLTTSSLLQLLSTLINYKKSSKIVKQLYSQETLDDSEINVNLFNNTYSTIPSYTPFYHNDISSVLEYNDFEQLFNKTENARTDSYNSPINLSPTIDPFFSIQKKTLNADSMGNKLNLLSSQEKILLNYFINSICPNCVCYPNKNKKFNFGINISHRQPEINPYLHLIVPLAFKSQIVMNTIMATSAHQLFKLGNNNYQNLSEIYSDRAIEQLSNIIIEKHQSNSQDWDEVLATFLMLCFKEISSNCDYRSSWVYYLNCAKHFLEEFNTNNKFTPLFKFFARYFVIHEVMGETAWLRQKVLDNENNDCNEKSSLSSFNSSSLQKFVNIDLNLTLNNETGKNDIIKYLLNENNVLENHDEIIDVVFGCCPYLISLIHKISNLGRCYEDLEVEPLATIKEFEIYIINQRNQIQLEIENLNQRTQFFEEIDYQSENYIKIIAEIKRLSTLLYLFARVDLETLHYNKGLRTKYFNEKYNYMKNVKSKLRDLYAMLPECPMSLLWPLFVLGLMSETADTERWFVLDKLFYLQKARELGSVKTAKDVVITVWKEFDLGLTKFRWKDMIKGRAESLSLA